MRFLIAALVCLGPVVTLAGGFKPAAPAASAFDSKRGPILNAVIFSVRKHPLPPTEGQNFYNSFIGPKGPFVWIRPGTFQMGSIKGTDPDRWSDEDQHQVTLTRGFWILDHEVTQGEYQWVMGRPLYFGFRGSNLPVENISWFEANDFCKELTRKDRELNKIRNDQEYRLPTEAEWEYAARAGTTGARYTVDGKDVIASLDLIAWWDGNSSNQTHPVKTKRPNAWGLYDMLGNVYEWCGDRFGEYPTGPVTDPTGPPPGSGSNARMQRGGSWWHGAGSQRSANRAYNPASFRYNSLGFRPVLSSVR